MRIELTVEQYLTLIKLVYLGNWVVNSFREEKDQIPEFNAVEELIYAQAGPLAEEIGLYRDDEGRFFPSQALENELMDYLDAYEEECFWEHLVRRLAYRDLAEEIGEEVIRMMPADERDEVLSKYEERYRREFEECGLENLRLIKIKI